MSSLFWFLRGENKRTKKGFGTKDLREAKALLGELSH
jgi:hypothetical protein